MPRFPIRLLLVPLVLAACQPSAPACRSPATKELRTIDRLIADTEATLARGYTTVDRGDAALNVCLGSGGDNVGVSFCTDSGKRRVAIDPATERRKLDGLLARRADLARQAEADRLACTGGAP